MPVPRIPREKSPPDLEEPPVKLKKGRFVKGAKRDPNAGRKKGSGNYFNRDLKEVLWRAGQMYGSDGKGKDGLLGCIQGIIRDRPESYANLLKHAFLPKQVLATVTTEVNEAPRRLSREELISRLQERGININSINLDKSQFASDRNLPTSLVEYANGTGNGNEPSRKSPGSESPGSSSRDNS